jgi:hypothetical protein
LVDAAVDIGGFEVVIVSATNGFHPGQPVIAAAVIVGAENERPPLCEELVGIAPAVAPGVEIGVSWASVDRSNEWISFPGLVILGVAQDAFDLFRLRTLPMNDFGLRKCPRFFKAGVETGQAESSF